MRAHDYNGCTAFAAGRRGQHVQCGVRLLWVAAFALIACGDDRRFEQHVCSDLSDGDACAVEGFVGVCIAGKCTLASESVCANVPDGDACAIEGFVGVCITGQCVPSPTPLCGNGQVDSDEACEPGVPLTATCASAGYYAGTLLCTECEIDTSACGGKCGDLVINGPETCDGAPSSCFALGFPLGEAACTGCQLDATACEYIGWQSDNLGITNSHDVWGTSSADVWFCADYIHRWDGTSWKVATNASCSSIWGFSSTEAYFAGAGYMWQFNGSSFALLPGPSGAGPGGGELTTLWGLSGNDMYAVLRYRDSGSSLAHWNGNMWSDVTFPGVATGIWGDGVSSLWAITNDQVLGFNGSDWEPETLGFTFAPESITGCDGDLLVVGVLDNGASTIIRKRAGLWSVAATLPVKLRATDIYCAKPNDVLIVGEKVNEPYGAAAVWFDGAIPFVLDIESQPASADAVWGSLHDQAFIAADFRYPHHAGAGWGASDYVKGKLWRSDKDLWSVSGTAVYRNGLPSYSTSTSLRDISGYGDDFVIVVGDTSAWTFSGGGWTPLPAAPTTYYLTGVAACSATTAVAVGPYTWLRYNGSGWSALPDPPENVVPAAVWCTGNDVFIVGSGNLVQHFNGTSWTVLRAFDPFAPVLTDVWASGPSDVFVVGDDGTALHWNGTSWRQLVIGPVDDFRAVHGTKTDDVFMATKHGTLYRWDGHVAYSLGGTLPLEPWGRDVDIWATSGAIYISNSLSPGRALVR